jgi:hypothetical protein
VALVHRVPDDAFYYLEIGARAGRGEGFSFDGLHATNGFHPLWQAMVVPVVGTLGTSDAALRAVLVLGLVCALAAVLLVARVVWSLLGAGPALFGGIVATQFGLGAWTNGMEGPVVLLALAVLVTALVWAARTKGSRALLVVGLTSGLLVLARLDFAPLILVVGVAIWIRWRDWRAAARWGAGLAAVGIPIGTWWLLRWGHVLTTSATVKAATLNHLYAQRFGGRFSVGYVDFLASVTRNYVDRLAVWSPLIRDSFVGSQLGMSTTVARGLALVVAGLVVIGWGRELMLRRNARAPVARSLSPEGWALATGAVIVVAKALFDLVSAPLWAADWYAAPQQLAVGFAVGAGAWLGCRALAARQMFLGVVSIALLAVVAVPTNLLSWRNVTQVPHEMHLWQDQTDLTADWIIKHGPAGRYGANDAGLLGYRLDGRDPVVNLDGLVNDYRFAQLASTASLRRRIAATRVDYFVGRLTLRDVEHALPCGRVLWSSPGKVPYDDPLTSFSQAAVHVVDVRGCQR